MQAQQQTAPQNQPKPRKIQNIFDQQKLLSPLAETATGQRLATLFPHGWQWLYAETPKAGTKPEWETVNKFPLTSVELWSLHQDETCIIGIRPNKATRWGILDIDITSPYHPQNNPEALPLIQSTLEDIGIVRTLINQSSHSGGLHLYLPLPETIGSYGLAVALKLHLSIAGFNLRSGQLEIFPNVKRYIPEGEGYSRYNGIRLPMQPNTGFIPLDADLTPLPWDLDDWLNAFDQAAANQDLDLLKAQIEEAKLNHRIRNGDRTPASLARWQERIEQEKLGWSGLGETNEKLKAFGCEARVFLGMDSEEQIAHHIEQSALATPGFHEHSNHQKDLKQRSRDVAAWAIKYYWPLGGPASRSTGYHRPEKSIADFNYHKAKREAAQHRIREAVAQLQSTNSLPAGAAARAKEIVEMANVSQQTLYKPINKPLWHPDEFPAIAPDPQEDPTPIEYITQPPIQREKTVQRETSEPLQKQKFTQLLFKVGFVILNLLIEAAAALTSEKGQKAAVAALPTADNPEQGGLGGEIALSDPEQPPIAEPSKWRNLRANLPESFQGKIAQAERQRTREQERETHRRQRAESRQLLLTLPPLPSPGEISPEPSIERAPIPQRLAPFVVPSPQSEPYQRPPTRAEQEEFETWYTLAEQFKLVSDHHWEDCEYWVETNGQWHPYCELSGTFTVRRLREYLGKTPHSESSISKDV